MIHNLTAATVALLLLTGVYLSASLNAAPAESKSGKVFRHVVLFKFKDGTSPEQVKEVVDAFRALKAKRILGITAGANGADVTKVYAKYFEASGFSVAAMERMAVELDSAQDVTPAVIAAVVKKAFAEHKGADAVYLLGPALEAMPLIAPLERELGVPVVQAIVARVWEIQKRLKVHEPVKGYGRLLETLPA